MRVIGGYQLIDIGTVSVGQSITIPGIYQKFANSNGKTIILSAIIDNTKYENVPCIVTKTSGKYFGVIVSSDDDTSTTTLIIKVSKNDSINLNVNSSTTSFDFGTTVLSDTPVEVPGIFDFLESTYLKEVLILKNVTIADQAFSDTAVSYFYDGTDYYIYGLRDQLSQYVIIVTEADMVSVSEVN